MNVLSAADLSLLDTIVKPMIVPRQYCLLEPGQICKTVYFVKIGWFRLYDLDTHGNEVNRRFTFENQFAVHFQSFISRQPSRYYLQAMNNSEVTAIAYEDIQYAYDQSKGWERLGRILAEQGYQQVNEKLELMQFHTPDERYQFILETMPELLKRVS